MTGWLFVINLLLIIFVLMWDQRIKAVSMIRLELRHREDCKMENCKVCELGYVRSLIIGRKFLGWKQGKHYEVPAARKYDAGWYRNWKRRREIRLYTSHEYQSEKQDV